MGHFKSTHSLLAVLLLLLVATLDKTNAFLQPSQRLLPRVASTSTTARPLTFTRGTIELSGLIYDSTSQAFEAWQWTVGTGAPAALIAGAVVVRLAETRLHTVPKPTDTPNSRFLKHLLRFLLLSSFALECNAIFVSSVTGAVLLGHGEQSVASKMVGYAAPLQLLQHHHELEYLTTQICFLQGLFHWLAAVVVDLQLPQPAETNKSVRRMNRSLGGWLVTLILWILAFSNHHRSFYGSYFFMLKRWSKLVFQTYVSSLRPLSFLYIPGFVYSIGLTWKAFWSPPELDH